MRIIKRPPAPREITTTCVCGCKFAFSKDEARIEDDPRDGSAFVIADIPTPTRRDT